MEYRHCSSFRWKSVKSGHCCMTKKEAGLDARMWALLVSQALQSPNSCQKSLRHGANSLWNVQNHFSPIFWVHIDFGDALLLTHVVKSLKFMWRISPKTSASSIDSITLLGTNISPQKGTFEDDFPFPMVGYVSSWRVYHFCVETNMMPKPKTCWMLIDLQFMIHELSKKNKLNKIYVSATSAFQQPALVCVEIGDLTCPFLPFVVGVSRVGLNKLGEPSGISSWKSQVSETYPDRIHGTGIFTN